MKQIIRKSYWNYEKEEKWLNEMSAKGLALSDYSWCRYVFTDSIPGEYIYRIELLKNSPKHLESQNYINFMEDNGIEHVASHLKWVYFRKKASDGDFDIYSDFDAKITHYKRINLIWIIVFGINMISCMYNIFLAIYIIAKEINFPSSIISLYVTMNLILSIFIFLCLINPTRNKIKKLKREQKIRE